MSGVLGGSTPGYAVTVFQKSTYTTLDPAQCRTLPTPPGDVTLLCPGLPGYPVLFSVRNQRTYLAASTAPETSRAAAQTLGAINSPFRHGHPRAALEWRFTIKDGRKVPFALIVRYFTERDGVPGEVLVVSRIAGADGCQIARIDAVANENAIVIARAIADDKARKLPCPVEPSIEGVRGTGPM